ncbi:30S ribosomal protein S3 [Sulfolobus acidocaldarius]|uniref:Small ribosomal subunit protein uS3 n=5 Tax=Sulfolobus acidocaldarius TaxID=2285 RepID=RS3_SULAC|nr:30S ribosomal protein S3 [Sulfolobus acidocaldarius]Q4JB46.1 RecName: Full=Small ribosomal subunit protein uS3; AltName: Full=30S ribosomal protein S3 [Sulfolobus acidocaldarius DSM 639]AAY79983.1 30S ribosomal protein S3P [Sulfolobus acidocaldarius DSM 639]AGE70552.1 30S ribosomal protein S3P [Sulfolobus acidocaldarius N8]AGE72825.1 30S ribosomal protein S3P [Sulfolobus acidocaldarius Ron12/I]ALU29089.1 30S ribosomal protein S3 [Sulfolobus acidocaldarius]ALU31815.1 30S ribosomal protein S
MVLIKRHFLQKAAIKVMVDEYLAKQFYNAEYAGVEIVKTPIGTRVIIYAGRPPLIIGKGGKTIKQLAQVLEKFFGLENPQITVTAAENPELNARVMAFRLAIALEKGYHFRRAAFITIRRIMSSGAVGAEVIVSGKLTSERAKYEKLKEGTVYKSGQQLEKIIDRAIGIAMLKPGVYGVEVVITKPTRSIDKIELKEKVEKTEQGGMVTVTNVSFIEENKSSGGVSNASGS